MPKIPGIVWALAAFVGLVLLLRGKSGAQPGSGSSLPSGSIGNVDVTQPAIMGSHLVQKTAGSRVDINSTWTAAARDWRGNPISWPYAIGYRFVRASNAQMGTMRFLRLGSWSNGTRTTSIGESLDSWFTQGDYHIIVSLYADTSSPSGIPNGDAVGEGTGVHLAVLGHSWAMRVA